MVSSAYQDEKGEWVYPQVHYKDGKVIAKKKIIEQVNSNTLIQEAIHLEPRVGKLIEKAKKERCEYGYNVLETFYGSYKPQIKSYVGFSSPHEALRSTAHYEAVYQAIWSLLPTDEVDLYEDGIMPNGMYSPWFQEKYGCEYP